MPAFFLFNLSLFHPLFGGPIRKGNIFLIWLIPSSSAAIFSQPTMTDRMKDFDKCVDQLLNAVTSNLIHVDNIVSDIKKVAEVKVSREQREALSKIREETLKAFRDEVKKSIDTQLKDNLEVSCDFSNHFLIVCLVERAFRRAQQQEAADQEKEGLANQWRPSTRYLCPTPPDIHRSSKKDV